MICDYCDFRYLKDKDECDKQQSNCKNFKLDWDTLDKSEQKIIKKLLNEQGGYYG